MPVLKVDFETNLLTCEKCDLHQHREQVVIGSGETPADILFVGECPGESEEKKQIPYVGKSGKLLRRLIKDTPISEDVCYFTNIVKCNPFNARDPFPWEIDNCLPHLVTQVKYVVHPKIIVGIGNIICNYLSKPHSYVLYREHGKILDISGGIKFIGIIDPYKALEDSAIEDLLIKDLKLVLNLWKSL
jgi:uracil-DNA glycosylase